jgi:hypothetical protein
MKEFPKFTNREYVYSTKDDAILIRGLQINGLIDHINSFSADTIVENIEAGSTEDIIVGDIATDDAVFIEYFITNGSLSEAGKIMIANNTSSLGWSRQSTGNDLAVVFATSISGGNILLSLTTDIGGGTTTFKYQKKSIEK